MKIKTFHARSFREALAQVKKEMGEDAVILSSREQKGLPPTVRVEAAVDYEVEEAASPRRPDPAPDEAPRGSPRKGNRSRRAGRWGSSGAP